MSDIQYDEGKGYSVKTINKMPNGGIFGIELKHKVVFP